MDCHIDKYNRQLTQKDLSGNTINRLSDERQFHLFARQPNKISLVFTQTIHK